MTEPVSDKSLLSIDDLWIGFGRPSHRIMAVRGLSLKLRPREILALVGESGSGKSTTGLAMLGLLSPETASVTGSIQAELKDGSTGDIVALPERKLRDIRGNDIAMVFQEPMSSLNPIYTIERQIVESLTVHRRMSHGAARAEALDLLKRLGLPSPEQCLRSFPHNLSGGMRQRVMIAMALSGNPSLLIADEPTTALDLTIQAQIIDLLKEIQQRTQMAILFITHDLGLVGDIAQRVLVMYAGQIVEEGQINEVFARPLMPYTQALMKSRPHFGSRAAIEAIPGTVPNLADLPQGCSFHPRCPHFVRGRCDTEVPALEEAAPGRKVRCLRWREIADGAHT